MKRNAIITALTAVTILAGLSACTTKLDPNDRALLTETKNLAEKAASQASMALAAAKEAQASAERAAMDAAASGKKADRIFRDAQQK